MKNGLLKKRLRNGEYVFGTWCELPSPEVINVLAKAGLDFVIIDMEHGSMDFTTASRMTISAQIEGCSPFIRVPKNDESDILRALEIGPSGIVVPHIESVSDRKLAVQSMMFPPLGTRSLNPFTRPGGYISTVGYTQNQNASILKVLIIEGKNGIKSIKEIIDEALVDIIYVGIYDISAAVGVPGDINNKKVLSALEGIVRAVRKKGKIVGCMFHDDKERRYLMSIGVQFLCYSVDTGVIFNAFKNLPK